MAHVDFIAIEEYSRIFGSGWRDKQIDSIHSSLRTFWNALKKQTSIIQKLYDNFLVSTCYLLISQKCCQAKQQFMSESIPYVVNVRKSPGSFHVNSTRPLNPPCGILINLGVYIIPTLVRNYAKHFFPRPHSFVCRRDQKFKNFPLLAIC